MSVTNNTDKTENTEFSALSSMSYDLYLLWENKTDIMFYQYRLSSFQEYEDHRFSI